MYSKHSARGEIHSIRSGRHIVIGKKSSTIDFQIRHRASAGSKVPLEIDGIEPDSVGGIRGLKHQEHGHCIHGVLKTPFQKPGAMRTRQDPAVAQSQVPDSSIPGAPWNAVAASGPNLHLAPTVLGRSLRATGAHKHEDHSYRDDDRSYFGWPHDLCRVGTIQEQCVCQQWQAFQCVQHKGLQEVGKS